MISPFPKKRENSAPGKQLFLRSMMSQQSRLSVNIFWPLLQMSTGLKEF